MVQPYLLHNAAAKIFILLYLLRIKFYYLIFLFSDIKFYLALRLLIYYNSRSSQVHIYYYFEKLAMFQLYSKI